MISAIIYFIFFAISRFAIGRKKKLKEFDSDDSWYLYTMLGAGIISLAGIQMDIMSRTIIYFSIFLLISVPNLIEKYAMAIKTKWLYSAILLVFLFAYSSMIIINRPEWNTAYDYQSCLSSGNVNTCLGIDE